MKGLINRLSAAIDEEALKLHYLNFALPPTCRPDLLLRLWDNWSERPANPHEAIFIRTLPYPYEAVEGHPFDGVTWGEVLGLMRRMELHQYAYQEHQPTLDHILTDGQDHLLYILDPRQCVYDTCVYLRQQNDAYSKVLAPISLSDMEPHPLMEHCCVTGLAMKPNWRKAEMLRVRLAMLTGSDEYDNPWGGLVTPPWFHFLRRSRKFPGMISFYENVERGVAERRTAMKPGRYLQRYFPNLEDGARSKALAMLSDHEVRFAVTADDIETLYRNGPGSCMSHPPSSFPSCNGLHPVRAYGDSDLQVAYLGDLNAAFARAVVWPERKLYQSVYGSLANTLIGKLRGLSYTKGSMSGARIRAIRVPDTSDSWLCPYLDPGGCSVGYPKDGWMTIGSREYESNTGGTVGEEADRYYCNRCEEGCDELYGGELGYCEYCYENHTWQCAHCEECFDEGKEDSINVTNHRNHPEEWCDSCLGDNAFLCEGTDKYYSDRVASVEGEDGCTYSKAYAEEQGWVENDGGWWGPAPEPPLEAPETAEQR